ncbi:UNVERIFIED_CONTAM: hypothetical protein Sangu_2709200 [Sesamum angustifolium]|uniref:Uncharacterized protein n=1 Tax=Sesamum angustifolium TaxID=2727405 RepID=A0AAW2IXA5_9LAMI
MRPWYPAYSILERGPPCQGIMEHLPQSRHVGAVGQRSLSQRRINLGLATEEGRFTTPPAACRNPQQNC